MVVSEDTESLIRADGESVVGGHSVADTQSLVSTPTNKSVSPNEGSSSDGKKSTESEGAETPVEQKVGDLDSS